MASTSGLPHVNILFLVWTLRVPDKVRALFTEVFGDVSQLTDYVLQNLTETDAFRLIIPFDCLEHLLNNPICHFRQLEHICVIYNTINDLKYIKWYYPSTYKKIEFCTIYDLIIALEKANFNTTHGSSNIIDRSTKDAILSLIEHRILMKQMLTSAYLSPILKQFSSTCLYDLPVKNITNFPRCCICSSCTLIHQQLYFLECKHQQCKLCVHIQKKCVICSRAVSYDKILLSENLHMIMQNLITNCSNCEWNGLWKDYEIHFKQNHYDLITCIIDSKHNDESSFYQEYKYEIIQENLPNNLSILDSDMSITSLNGTCIWKISNIKDLIDNSQYDEQKSIYSCPFYIFPNGYKMCLRLYINGDGNARNTHMSIFFIIMRGEHDENLQWPFKLKVTFTLIDQTIKNNDQYHIDKYCWPDATEICFKCPKTDMNIAYGLSKFYPLELFKQNQYRYVKNDIMLIKIDIDALTERPTLPLMVGAGELPNDEEHVHTIDDDIFQMICSPSISK